MGSTRSVVGLMLTLVVASAGCLGALTGGGPIEFTASEATVATSALNQAEYEHEETRPLTVNRTVDLQGESRTISITNQVSTYRAVDETVPLALVAVVSTPQAEVVGQPLNPLGRMSKQELVRRLGSQYAEFGALQEVDSRQATILDQQTEVTRFATTIEQGGQQVDVFVEVVRVQDGDDFVIAIAVYPRQFEVEAQDVLTVFEGIDH